MGGGREGKGGEGEERGREMKNQVVQLNSFTQTKSSAVLAVSVGNSPQIA